MADSNETPPQEEQFENNGEGNPPIEEPQGNEGTPPSEDGTPPQEPKGSDNGEGGNPPPAPETNYYTPEEMKTLQVDGIDTSRIPPEMQPLYQAMQAPITRKSQELSDKMKNLGQGQQPPQENQPQQQQAPQQPSIDEVAVNLTLNALGLQKKPDAWDDGYEAYVMQLGDTRRDLKDSATRQNHAMNELNTFKSGFTPEQFQQIDSEAETKMYSLLADPATRQEGQRIQQALQTGNTNVVLAFVRDVAKEVLSAPTTPTKPRSTPPVTITPQGGNTNTGGKDPSKMNNDEYRAYRNSQS